MAVADRYVVEDVREAVEVDGEGGYLLPGLTDAHIHAHSPENLTQSCQWGITTGLDMVSFPPTMLASLRNQQVVAEMRSAGTSAPAPGSLHSGGRVWRHIKIRVG